MTNDLQIEIILGSLVPINKKVAYSIIVEI
jgi:hypothetical protein